MAGDRENRQWEWQNLFRRRGEPGILELWEPCRPCMGRWAGDGSVNCFAVVDLPLNFLRLGSIMDTFILSFLSENSIREREWR